MDVIRESIEEQAKEAWDLSWERKEHKDIPVYPHSADHAREHEETALFRASHQANVSCKEAIEAAVAQHYGNNRLGEGALPQVVEQFGLERTLYVLANTVQQKDHDGRISRDNKAWAATVPVAEVQDLFGFDHRREFVVDQCNPGLVDILLNQARRAEKEQAQEKPSVLQKLKQEPPERKPAAQKKREPER